MRRYTVVVGPEALNDLAEIEWYIARQGSPRTAAAYADRILTYLEGFAFSPQRGASREDLGPGVHVTNFERRVSIVFSIDGERVLIGGLAYGGRPIERIVRERF